MPHHTHTHTFVISQNHAARQRTSSRNLTFVVSSVMLFLLVKKIYWWHCIAEIGTLLQSQSAKPTSPFVLKGPYVSIAPHSLRIWEAERYSFLQRIQYPVNLGIILLMHRSWLDKSWVIPYLTLFLRWSFLFFWAAILSLRSVLLLSLFGTNLN